MQVYGFEFPDSLFLLHEFLVGLEEEEWGGFPFALEMEGLRWMSCRRT
jgi:hypothetical protein